MLEEGIFAAILVVSAFIFFLFIWKLWHCWSQSRRDQTSDEASEPLILEVEDVPAVQTVKREVAREHSLNRSSKVSEVPDAVALDFDRHEPKSRNTITLEVISGPSTGTRVSHPSGQSVTVGRISQNNLVLNDPEVSGKHACIKWNSQKSVWELMDMGSLNGTSINDQAISLNQSRTIALRKPGIPVELATGDIVSLGATSQVLVRVCNDKQGSTLNIRCCPFDVGVASDPMALRRGGKRLFMEDVSFCEWPLRGLQQFGAFCVFDGHGGAAAAAAASKILPQKLFDVLRVDAKHSEVLYNSNATDVLKAAFDATEEALDHEVAQLPYY